MGGVLAVWSDVSLDQPFSFLPLRGDQAKLTSTLLSILSDHETLDALVTLKSDGTKDIFVTYVERSAADAAVSKINATDFPAGMERIAIWTNLAGKKPPLKATKVVSVVFSTHVERWLKGGGVISYAGEFVSPIRSQKEGGES